MKKVILLAWAFFREHPMRIMLTSLAAVAAAAMVVWVVAGYDALLGSFDRYSNLALGRYPLSVAPIQHFSQQAPGAIPLYAEKYVPEELVDAMRQDSAVVAADAMWSVRTRVRPYVAEGEEAIDGKWLTDRILATDAEAPPFEMVEGRWIDGSGEDDVAMRAAAARAVGLKVGDALMVGEGDRVRKLTIVGFVGGPEIEGWSGSVASSQLLTPSVGGLFMSRSLAEKVTGEEAKISFVGVGLREDADVTEFRYRWAPQLSGLSTPSQFQEAYEIEEALDESASAENVRVQAQMATVVSMLAALFIIFSTLNMGVNERGRQLAILRAVGLTRWQVGGLITVEGLFFGTIGFVGGCLAGQGLIYLASQNAPELIGLEGAVVGKYSILLAGVCSYGGAFLASVPPAIRAMRVRPADAMGPVRSFTERGLSCWALVIGVVLLAVYPVLGLIPDYGDDAPVMVYLLLGLVALAAGCILLTPAAVFFVDRICGPMLAKVLGVPRQLLASQLSGNLGRTVSTAIALTVGLGLYIGIQVWGHTMLSGFLPGSWAPDGLIAFKPGGLAEDRAREMGNVEGVRKALPIVVEQPRLKEDLTQSASRATVVRQDNVIIIGIDAEEAFGGGDPLMRFDWVRGNAGEALEMMKSGRGCIVPEHFLHETGLGVGDRFTMVPPERPEVPVSYTIAGSVRLQGWHWQSKPTGFRTRTHRSAAMIFAPYERVAEDFQFQAASHVWMNYDEAVIGKAGLEEAGRDLYAGVLGREVKVGEARNEEPYVQVHDIADIRALVHGHATGWLWVMSRLPLVVLAITSIGVLNALLAAVQSRRWEMGVLRSIGFSRGVLVRLVIAEGVLIGGVAVLISVVFGVLSGWCGAEMSAYLSFFGGMEPDLVIPWVYVIGGVLLVLVLAAFAAVWPAVTIGRAKPLDLLRHGRGGF